MTHAEIKKLVDRGLTLTDLIDWVIKENGIIGVGLISFGDDIAEYIKSKGKRGMKNDQ